LWPHIHILKLKCTKFVFCWGSARDPARGGGAGWERKGEWLRRGCWVMDAPGRVYLRFSVDASE